jgi:predicted CxxxxCH...CXXCH cytochrome family protein
MRRHLLVTSIAMVLAAAGCGSSQTAEGHAPGCDSCHGFPAATASHATAPGGTWEATDCNACHPTSVNTAGTVVPTAAGGTHIDGVVDAAGHATPYPPAEHGPDADRGLASCQLCHGTNLDGGSAGVSCDACHAAPAPGGAGIANWQTNCTFCHGTRNPSYVPADLPTAAPPEDVGGATAIGDVTVGVHRAHTQNASVTNPLDCSACHLATPTSALVAGHLDPSPAEIPFGTVAKSRGSLPVWDRTDPTCGTTWCHGRGGNVAAPNWTVATPMNCDSCHLTADRTDVLHTRASSSATSPLNCTDCHGTRTLSNHVDGNVAIPGVNCARCHGTFSATPTLPRDAAPPVDTLGRAAGIKVGAHAKHLDGGTATSGFACTTCHPDVAGYTLTHANGAPDVRFVAAVVADGTYDAGASRCDNTYCHGTFTGGTGADPIWSDAAMACNSCHSSPPNTGDHGPHLSRTGCSTCHTGYTASTVNLTNHVNGIKNVAAGWNGASCSNGCHGTSEGTWY